MGRRKVGEIGDGGVAGDAVATDAVVGDGGARESEDSRYGRHESSCAAAVVVVDSLVLTDCLDHRLQHVNLVSDVRGHTPQLIRGR